MVHFQVSVFITFVCFIKIKSEVLTKLNKEIVENIEHITSVDDENILNVTFKDSKRYHVSAIYLPQNKVDSISKEYAFHSALNCKFADWTVKKMFDFVGRSPHFYQRKFQRYKNVDLKSALKSDFQNSLNYLINILDEHLGHFINILKNFLDTNSNLLYYYDTSVLETLVSIKININYVLIEIEDPDVNRTKYYHIVRCFVKEMMKLQSVLSLNCKDISINHNNSQFYGYWISVDDVKDRNKGIDVFFSHVKKIKLESDNYLDCTSTSVLISLSQANDINIDISESFVKDDRQNRVSIKEILDLIRISYDTDLIYFYQNLMLIITMRLIFHKIREILVLPILPVWIHNYIEKIHSLMDMDRTNFPVYLANGFMVLNNLLKKNLDEQESDISNFLLLLENDKYDVTFVERTEYTITKYLTEILANILENIEYLKCFKQYHKSLSIKYEKNYILPLMSEVHSLILRRFSTAQLEFNHNKQVCTFVSNIYSLCFEALMLFQQEYNPYDGLQSFTEKSIDVFERIQTFFFIIIRQPEHDIYLLKMALKITPIIVAITQKFRNGLSVAAIKRITNVIMDELNIIGIYFCSSLKQNFLLFNNIHFLEYGNHELMENSILQFFQMTYPNFIPSYFAMSCKEFMEYKYFDLDSIYTELISNRLVYKAFENNILVYWKGQKKNLYQIYQDISILTFSPYTLYSFYDIIYKFYIAVFYDIMLTAVVKQKQTREFEKEFDEFDSDNFPQQLWPLISNIKSLYLDSVMNDKNTFMRIKNFIEELFKKFNFVLVKKQINKRKIDTYFTDCIYYSITYLKSFIEEIKLILAPYGVFQKYVLKNFTIPDINVA